METVASVKEVSLTTAAMKSLAVGFKGQLIGPHDADYETTRRIWNGMVDRRPALIARCADAHDVASAVSCARERGLLLSVRGGGHNVAGNAVCDGGLMLDLSRLNGVAVDAAARTACAGGGCTWRDLDQATCAHGLATTGGIIPATGIGGLTLGGGLGWLMRKHGLSCDNLLSAEIVTADGELCVASETENADLFWGLRGGGGNFGVVTSLRYRLHAVGRVVGGMLIHRIDRARDVLRFWRDFAATAPDAFGSMPVLLTSPDGEKVLAIVVCYCGEPLDGERVLQPLRDFSPALADQIATVPYIQQQGLLEAGFPPGRLNYWKSSFLKELNDEAISVALEFFAQIPSVTSAIAFEQMGGAMSRVGADETAFSHRQEPFNFLVVSSWDGRTETDANVSWTRSVWRAMQPYAAAGVYVNYLDAPEDEGIERIKSAYGVAKYERLAALKRKYDPGNLFRLNQNIRP